MNYLKVFLQDEENKYFNFFLIVVFTLLTIALFWVMIASLQWRMVHDSPIMLYIAFLIDRFGFIPYRDIFDMNMPGTYFLYYLIGHFSNYTDLGFRIADLLFLAGILTSTWFWLRHISLKAAWCATVSFGLLYFSWGPNNSLQREYMLLLPVSLALLLTISFPRLNNVIRLLLVGCLCGFSFLIKPHAIIFFIAIAIYQILDFKQNEKGFKLQKIIIIYFLGFIIPNLIAFVYLWAHGALPYFFDSAMNYLPLYGQLTGNHTTISGAGRVKYLIKEYFSFGSENFSFGTLATWFIPTILGTYLSLRFASLTKQQRDLIWLVVGLAVLASIYPVFSGQFWAYHYFFFLYFVVIAGSCCVISLFRINKLMKALPIVAFLFVFSSQIHYLPELLDYAKLPPKNGFVDQIASFLESNVQEGDTVQPLDWTAGVVHAMLIAKVRIATPFIYDFHFYHHVSNPYIRSLRKRFVGALQKSKPGYVVQINFDTQSIKGTDTTRSFPELDNILKTEYKVEAFSQVVKIYVQK